MIVGEKWKWEKKNYITIVNIGQKWFTDYWKKGECWRIMCAQVWCDIQVTGRTGHENQHYKKSSNNIKSNNKLAVKQISKESLNNDCHQFLQYQQDEQSPLILNDLTPEGSVCPTENILK